MSENSTVARICNTAPSECGAKSITLCLEDFKSLSEGAKQFDKLVNMKVAAALAQEIEKLKTATEDTLDKAPRADAAEYAVEGELRRCQLRKLSIMFWRKPGHALNDRDNKR
ncbi:BnaC04g55500D [Brassica napus]|uniref:Uncharacterized protein n=3 Tax=Brassica TaxID=3705 RepID=A0A0D3BXL4_BRAOL|nr:unnamed protein product [Brassica napus]CDY62812.1 BnaC04g55500D [Brassica napus]VDD09722.1 unnamed protein product [Brassica oleracea]